MRLWDKGESLDHLVHRFTVGDDPVIDVELVPWDCAASAAHARMLLKIGLLSAEECKSLLQGLKSIVKQQQEGKFQILPEQEDCHTAIEEFLTKSDSEKNAGAKIHTGRSRNDQVLVAMRLFLRASLLERMEELNQLSQVLLQRAEEQINTPMPGYTHFQRAMPTTVGIWLHAFAESFLALAKEGWQLLEALNINPLGAASGFGVPLPLDRKYTAELLGFKEVQRNPIAVANSRGIYELKFVRWCVDVAALIEKLSCDIVLFSTEEFGFFALPTAFTTGSSIMPQKRNPDVVELLRASAAKLRGAEEELSWVIGKLPSSYHRDHQFTKGPVIKAAKITCEVVNILREVIAGLVVNRQQLEAAMSAELYVTYEAYRRVKAGEAFRSSYLAVAQEYRANAESFAQPEKLQALRQEFALIAQSALEELGQCKQELKSWQCALTEASTRYAQLMQAVFKS